jgi:hypothetical protein
VFHRCVVRYSSEHKVKWFSCPDQPPRRALGGRRGTARVTIGDNVSFLHENESIYVSSGARHRLENPGKIDLELIEVQTFWACAAGIFIRGSLRQLIPNEHCADARRVGSMTVS